ncbi:MULTISPECIES: DUF2584 domain-containing protein [Bacillus]|uniref:DUF2584 domain-containing protein n=1 Tax=Bacillus TaxID=1386 RepID=UPI0002F469C4|nr:MULTISPECIES: DUF2584 domain-containing protein [Bacillus]
MGMPLELNTMIVTKGKEERLKSNDFSLKKNGYRLYPIEIPLPVKKTMDGETSGTGIIKKVVWEKNHTIITYELTSLHSVN